MKIGTSEKTIDYLFLFAGSILIIPFLLISFFNVPSSDDFLYAKFLRESRTIGSNLACYFGWGGRYFSNLLLTTCNPLSYSNRVEDFLVPYQLHSVVLLLSLIVSFFFLIKRTLGNERRVFPFSFLILGLLLFFLKDLNELLYWMAGSYTYCYGMCFCLMAIFYATTPPENVPTSSRKSVIVVLIMLAAVGIAGILFRKSLIVFLDPKPILFFALIGILSLVCLLLPFLKGDSSRSSGMNFSLVFTSSFLSIGSNEIYAFLLVPFLGSLSIYRFWSSKNIPWANAFFTIAAVAFAALNLFAPSTFARRRLQTNNSAPSVLFDAEHIGQLLSYFGFFLVFAVLVFALYLFWRKSGKITGSETPGLFSANFGIVLSVAAVFYLLVVTPLVLTFLSGTLPDRAKNPLVILAVFPLLWVITQLAERLNKAEKLKWPLLIGGILLFVAQFQLFHLSRGWMNASQFLLSGNGPRSIEVHKRRFHTLSACKTDTCIIEKNPFHPGNLFNIESAILDEDPLSWKNYKRFSYAEYFEKKSIIAR